MQEFEATTITMDEAAKMWGESVLPPEAADHTKQALVPAGQPGTGLYAEPIITAQPCQVVRNIPAFLQRIKALAQMAGEDYYYRFPVKDKTGAKKSVEGPSITLANDLAREYMNCMIDVRVAPEGESNIFYARFIDYETGFCMTRAFRQRKNQKTMNTDAERAADIVFQIGQSKAIRNVVVNALQTYADFAFREAQNSLVQRIGKELEKWRNNLSSRIESNKFDLRRIEAQIGKPITEWLAPDVARVIAELKAIADGMASFDDIYPDPNKQEHNAATKTDAIKDKLKAKAESQPTQDAAPQATVQSSGPKLEDLLDDIANAANFEGLRHKSEQALAAFPSAKAQEAINKATSDRQAALTGEVEKKAAATEPGSSARKLFEKPKPEGAAA